MMTNDDDDDGVDVDVDGTRNNNRTKGKMKITFILPNLGKCIFISSFFRLHLFPPSSQ